MQAVQETLLTGSSRVKPGMQAVQVEAPVSRRVSRPLGHKVHLLAAYMDGRKRRLGQGLQLVAAVALAPVRGSPVTLPAGHTLQALEPAALAGKAAGGSGGVNRGTRRCMPATGRCLLTVLCRLGPLQVTPACCGQASTQCSTLTPALSAYVAGGQAVHRALLGRLV